jgi:hypothetical protein
MSFGFQSSTLTPSSVADYWYGRVPGKMSVAISITAKEQRDTRYPAGQLVPWVVG